MNPIRRLFIRLGLRPVTTGDLTTLLDRVQDKSLPIQARFQALIEYVSLTQPDERIAEIIDHLNQIISD
jgi:hypothetical protein